MNFPISFGICSTPKLSKYVTFSAFTNNGHQWVPIDFEFSIWSDSSSL